MTTVIIVDDEILARIGIQSLLENMEDIRVAGTFGDAMDALEFLKNTLVDIVITDIEMPGLNGLEFIRKIREDNLAEGIIILSCYDRFEYAREAISLGTDGYILKHDISRENIERELRDVAKKISGRKEKSRREESPEPISEDDQTLMTVGVIKAEDRREGSEELRGRMAIHLLDEIVSHYKMGYLMDSVKRDPFVIFRFSGEPSESQRRKLLDGYAEVIEKNIFQYTNRRVYLGISGSFFGTQRIPAAYEEAERGAELRFYQEKRTVFYAEDILWQEDAPELIFSETEFVSERGAEIFAEELHRYLAVCRERRVRVKAVQEMLVQSVSAFVLNVLISAVRDKEAMAGWRSRYSFVEIISGADTCSLLEQRVLEQMKLFHGEIRQWLETDEMGGIFSYIDQHIDGRMTLEDLAELQRMSVSAFSKKFKEKTSMTPVQYINQKKVEKVKEYLKAQEYTLGEIAELTGFSNENYMVRVFKKITGETITDFRKKLMK